jgi:type IV secretory pathway TrbF-like protein
MIENHMVVGKKYRDDELGEATVRGANWRYAAFGSFGISGLLSLLLFYTVTLPKQLLVPIEVCGESGTVRIVQQDWKQFVPPMTAYIAQLRDTVILLRTITTDKEAMRAQHRTVRLRLTAQGKPLYDQYLKDRKPFEQKEPVQVEVSSVLHDGGLTWDIRWRETTYSHKIDIEHWRGKFTFTRAMPQTDAERQATPLGLFVDHWSWSRE